MNVQMRKIIEVEMWQWRQCIGDFRSRKQYKKLRYNKGRDVNHNTATGQFFFQV